jgi:predicted NBD/HSP70 family sugar kinase
LDDLYRRKDPKALAIMAQYGIWLNLFLQQIEDSVHPTLLILGGGLMNAKMMRKIVTLPPEKYAFAQLGNLAGVVGAASLPFSN